MVNMLLYLVIAFYIVYGKYCELLEKFRNMTICVHVSYGGFFFNLIITQNYLWNCVFW